MMLSDEQFLELLDTFTSTYKSVEEAKGQLMKHYVETMNGFMIPVRLKNEEIVAGELTPIEFDKDKYNAYMLTIAKDLENLIQACYAMNTSFNLDPKGSYEQDKL